MASLSNTQISTLHTHLCRLRAALAEETNEQQSATQHQQAIVAAAAAEKEFFSSPYLLLSVKLGHFSHNFLLISNNFHVFSVLKTFRTVTIQFVLSEWAVIML